MSKFRAILPTVLCLFALVPTLAAQMGHRTTPPPMPWMDWLNGPAKQDIAWQVHAYPASLSWGQRQIVLFKVRVDPVPLQERGPHRNLHVFFKAQDSDGQWLPDESYTHLELERDMGKAIDLEFEVAAFVRPGHYTFGVVLDDSVMDERSVMKLPVTVEERKGDPLPGSDATLPPVEFVDLEPDEQVAQHRSEFGDDSMAPPFARRGAIGRRRGDQTDDGFPDPRSNGEPEAASFGRASDRLTLPLDNRRPLAIEVVANFSPTEEYADSAAFYHRNSVILLHLMHVLSQVKMQGCMRISGLDTVNRRVIAGPLDVAKADWAQLEQSASTSAGVIDVNALKHGASSTSFARDYIQQLMQDKNPCGDAAENPQRVLIVLNSGIKFPDGTRIERVQPVTGWRTYYLRRKTRTVDTDQFGAVIAPLDPREFAFGTASDFRKTLATLLLELRSLAR